MTQDILRDQEPIALHQTILLSRATEPALFVLTMPKYEVALDDEPLPEIAAELLPGPGPVLTSERWAKVWRQIDRSFIWKDLMEWPSFWGPPWHDRLEREVSRLRQVLAESVERPQFARAMFEGLVGSPAIPPVYSTYWPVPRSQALRRRPYWPYLPVSPVLAALHWQIYLNRDELELSEEAIGAWIHAASVLSAVTARARSVLESLLDFDVPFSLSRPTDKRTLSSILAEARLVTFVPMAPGALQAANLIGQGNYAVAMEVAAASGGVTLVLAATYSLAEFLLNLPRRRRRTRR